MATPQELLQQSQDLQQSLQTLYGQFPELTRDLQNVRAVLEQQLQTEKDIIKQIQIRRGLEENRLQTVKAVRDELAKEYQTELALEENLKKRNVEINKELTILQNIALRVGQTADIQAKMDQLQKERVEVGRRLSYYTSQQHQDNLKILKDRKDEMDAVYKQIQILEKHLQSVAQFETKMVNQGKSLAKEWLGLRESGFDFLNSAESLKDVLGTISFSVQKIGLGFASMVNAGSILAKIFDSTKALVLELETQASITASITGRQRQYTGELYNAAVANREFGITLTETSSAFNELYKNLTVFSQISEESRKNTTLLASQMAVLGVSSQTSTKMLDTLTIALRMSLRASEQTLVGLANLGKEIGIDINRIQTELAATIGQLSVYGKQGIDVFKGLAAASKVTGIAISRLGQIFGRTLDTFEGSANVAGRLNSILGRDLVNSVDLLYAKEDERIRIVKRAIDAQGIQWQGLNKFHRMAIATAAGITDMNEANRIFGMSLVAYDEMRLKAQLAETNQKQFQESVKASVTFMKQLKVAFQNFAVAVQPLVVILGKVVSGISWVLNVAGQLNQVFEGLGLVTLGIAAIIGSVFIPFLSPLVGIVTAIVGGFAALLHIFTNLDKYWNKFKSFFGFGDSMKETNKQAKELHQTLTHKKSPAFWELPKHMALGMNEYSVAIKSTTPNIEKFAQQSEVLHKVQTKPGSPALWQISSVMAQGVKEYGKEVRTVQPQITKMTANNQRFVNATTNTQNNTEISNLTNRINNLEQRKNNAANVSVDVNFLDIEATKRSFRDAVLQAIEETYA